MLIKKIKVSNFKSFNELDLDLRNFNIVIGANASGKSNFIHIFEFINDIANYGLENAISIQGGVEYLRNVQIGNKKDLRISIVSEQHYRRDIDEKENMEFVRLNVEQIVYDFSLRFKQRGLGFEISQDKIKQKVNIVKLKGKENRFKPLEEPENGEIVISSKNGNIEIDDTFPSNSRYKKKINEAYYRFIFKEDKIPSKRLLLESEYFYYLYFPFKKLLGNIRVYDFDPKLPKKATPITGKATLENDGSNVSIVLKNIISNSNNKRKFVNMIKDTLPFVSDIKVEIIVDKSLLFKVKEQYSEKCYLPASLLSDGTINIAALIIALYFEKAPLTIIEEPERNIHPSLISKIISMMKDASSQKQIIVTTHNPEMIKHADLDDILLVSRDSDGFSKISRPAEKDEVKVFLENNMGIEDLYVQNILEI